MPRSYLQIQKYIVNACKEQTLLAKSINISNIPTYLPMIFGRVNTDPIFEFFSNNQFENLIIPTLN
jgi:hypothetical protein